jgi:hypothetical protein
VWEEGIVGLAGQIATTREGLRAFADSLVATEEVAIEATCNTHAIAKLIAPRVARLVISNPLKTRAIAEAKVKTDTVDAQVLAQLLAADYLPFGVDRRRADPGAAPSGRAAGARRAAAHPAEEPGAVDPSP